MNIVFLSRRAWPLVGGVEGHLEGLCRELVSRGHEILLVTEQTNLDLSLEEIHDGYRILRIPYSDLGGKMGILKWVFKHRELLSSFDVIHAHDVFWWLMPLLPCTSKSNRFVTFHGYEPDKLPDFRRRLHRKIIVWLSNKSIAVGSFIHRWYGIDTDVTLYGAYDSLESAETSPGDGFVFIGRISEDAGIFEYIRLVSLFKKKELIVYGPGDSSDIARMKELAGDLGVTLDYKGVTTNPLAAVREARYVLSSQYLTMLLAMQQKRLVLSLYDTDLKRDYLNCHPQSRHIVYAGSHSRLFERFRSLSPTVEKEMIDTGYEWAKLQTYSKLGDTYEEIWK